MKVCIKDNEFNPSFVALYGEEKAKEQGYTIVEAPEDCCFEDFVNLKFNQEKYEQRKHKEEHQQRIPELKLWFNTYYTEHEQKYRRLHSLNLMCDNGSKPYDKLLELYKEAEEKRKQIQELGG